MISIQSKGMNGTISDSIVARLPEGTKLASYIWGVLILLVVAAVIAVIGILRWGKIIAIAFKRRCLDPIPIHIPVDVVKLDPETFVRNEKSYKEFVRNEKSYKENLYQ